jgi:hypothetical protein
VRELLAIKDLNTEAEEAMALEAAIEQQLGKTEDFITRRHAKDAAPTHCFNQLAI